MFEKNTWAEKGVPNLCSRVAALKAAGKINPVVAQILLSPAAFVIPSEARNLFSVWPLRQRKEREIPRFARNDRVLSFFAACQDPLAFRNTPGEFERHANRSAEYHVFGRYLRIRSGSLPQGVAGRTAPAYGLTSRGLARARSHQRPARMHGGSRETHRKYLSVFRWLYLCCCSPLPRFQLARNPMNFCRAPRCTCDCSPI